MKNTINPPRTGLEIAIIGMSGRFPGAASVNDYWQSLVDGKELISHFTNEELGPHVSNEVYAKKNYIKAKGYLKNIEYFDASFFGYNSREASQLSPQSRVFQECVWECFEDAGYNLPVYEGSVGVYAGASSSLLWQLLTSFDATSNVDQFSSALLNDKDYLATRTSYQLNLKGPSITINTACSTSLVAIHMACRALLTRECDIAVAGGITVTLPTKAGYFFEDGMINSPDGHCRPFDKNANGTVFSDGAGVVLLKPLQKAIQDRDHIHAVILGSAINNDGRSKVGFTAPSMSGQADVIRQAYHMSKVAIDSVSYIETHGTGTQLGDPIEMEAIKAVFGKNKALTLGSVKSNMGHLDAAAGVASLIKVVLSLKNNAIPKTLHFDSVNDKIDLSNTGFVINTDLVDWTDDTNRLRAGVNSFGIGGTNAHLILEQSPLADDPFTSSEDPVDNVIVFSAKTEESLYKYLLQIRWFVQEAEFKLHDLTYTQNFGRAWFDKRAAFRYNSREDFDARLEQLLERKNYSDAQARQKVIFAFGGIGSEYPDMGADLFKHVGVFRSMFQEIQRDAVLVESGINIQEDLYAGNGRTELDENREIVLFSFEYVMAKSFMALGVEPFFMIGHGVGEYVAAVLSGVLSISDAYRILLERRRINTLTTPPAMLSVQASFSEITLHLIDGISVAACNAAASTVVTGTPSDIDTFQQVLSKAGVRSSRIANTQIFNTETARGALGGFDIPENIKINKPVIPYVSCITGEKVSGDMVQRKDYWHDLMASTIRFDLGIVELLKYENAVFLELSPSMVISSWVNRNSRKLPTQTAINTVKNRHERISDVPKLNEALIDLWKKGLAIHFDQLEYCNRGKRMSMPVYQFDRTYSWIDKEYFDAHPVRESSQRAEKGMATKKEIEEQLQRIWAQIVGEDSINPEKNLFETGITSLDAIHVNRKLKEKMDIHIEVTAMFEYPTIGSLAEHLFELQKNSLLTSI